MWLRNAANQSIKSNRIKMNGLENSASVCRMILDLINGNENVGWLCSWWRGITPIFKQTFFSIPSVHEIDTFGKSVSIFFRLSFCVLFLMFSTLRFDWYINHWARVQSNDADLQVRASTQPRSSSIWLLFSSLFSLFIFFSARDNERLTQFCLALLFELLLLIFFFVTFYECIVVS